VVAWPAVVARILVTGSDGTLGRPLVAELRRRGHTVTGCDLHHGADEQGIRADVREHRQLERVMREAGPFDYVYHLAAEFGRLNGEEYYETLWTTNVIVSTLLRSIVDPAAESRRVVSREELKALLAMEPDEADVTTAEAEMIDKIFDLGDTTVREVMVPLIEVAMLPETATPGDAIALVTRRGFSRIPIYARRETDIVGVVTAMDLLQRGADGATLIVGESFASRLSAWDIEADGSLSNRRVWAPLAHGVDGICIDAHGAVWCSTQTGCERVREGGEVTRTVPHDLFGFSCALGGVDGRTLFMIAAEWNGYENIGKGPRTGRVFTASVEVPGVAR